MSVLGFLVAAYLFLRVQGRFMSSLRARRDCGPGVKGCGPASWHESWQREWAEKFRRQAERRDEHWEKHTCKWSRRGERHARRWARRMERAAGGVDAAAPEPDGAASPSGDDQVLGRARRRAAVEAGFYAHLMSYLGVVACLALVNLMTTRYPWFLWPALGWGIGIFSHYMAVFGSRAIRERYFEPAVEREVRREKVAMHTEKQASIDELSSTLAHELRNPIAAAKSLVQQMGEDPTSIENVEYAKVALEELGRVERSIAHLLKYAKEEDYSFAPVSVAAVVDAALTEMRGKLDAAKVAVARNYIGGPTIVGDKERLRQVFANIVDNAIDALAGVPEGRHIDIFIANGAGDATVRLRDNGCGIPADRIERIFNPFFTTKEKGTGLGMAICKKIVEAHEGTIDVVSEVGRGTEFVVALPTPG